MIGTELTVELAIISDTHLPKGTRRLPDACLQRLAAADRIIHAGDLSVLDVLAQLRALGPPVIAVHGNVDDAATRSVLPETSTFEAGGRRIAVVHDAGPARGRGARMARRFPGAAVVVFGHSHIPLIEQADGGPLLVNPGSPTERRRAAHHTMATGTVTATGIAFALVELD